MKLAFPSVLGHMAGYRFGPLLLVWGQGNFWFRLYGYGLSIADQRQIPPVFAKRYGHKRILHVGPYDARWLSR